MRGRTIKYALRGFAIMAIVAGMVLGFVELIPHGLASPTPRVALDASRVGPREIEDLTEHNIVRDYGFAWQALAEAREQNRTDLIDGYFTGFAHDDLKQAIQDQKQTGVRTRYIDNGHKLEAFFYAPGGDAMELRDTAQLQMQVLDGDKVIHDENVTVQYLVLMTPGADRWYVRVLQAVPPSK